MIFGSLHGQFLSFLSLRCIIMMGKNSQGFFELINENRKKNGPFKNKRKNNMSTNMERRDSPYFNNKTLLTKKIHTPCKAQKVPLNQFSLNKFTIVKAH